MSEHQQTQSHPIHDLPSQRSAEEPVDHIPAVSIRGGKVPRRMRKLDAGYDVFARAINNVGGQDSEDSRVREEVFDFKTMPTDHDTLCHIEPLPCIGTGDCEYGCTRECPQRWGYALYPDEEVTVALGFAAMIPQGYALVTVARSSWAMRDRISTEFSIVDPGFDGESSMLLRNCGRERRMITIGMRIGQVAIVPVVTLPFRIVDSIEGGPRGSDGFGSSEKFFE